MWILHASLVGVGLIVEAFEVGVAVVDAELDPHGEVVGHLVGAPGASVEGALGFGAAARAFGGLKVGGAHGFGVGLFVALGEDALGVIEDAGVPGGL